MTGFPVVKDSGTKARQFAIHKLVVSSLPLYAAKPLAAYFLYSLHRLHDQFSWWYLHMPHWLVYTKVTEISREHLKSTVYFLGITA